MMVMINWFQTPPLKILTLITKLKITRNLGPLNTDPGWLMMSLVVLSGATADDLEDSHCRSFECYRNDERRQERHDSVAGVDWNLKKTRYFFQNNERIHWHGKTPSSDQISSELSIYYCNHTQDSKVSTQTTGIVSSVCELNTRTYKTCQTICR